ncbi:hypothetical protein D9M73_163440 [compost metagenome]
MMRAPPGRDVGQDQVRAKQPRRQARQERAERRRFEHPRARHIGDDDIARRRRIDQPGDANARMRIERQRIEQTRVDAVPQCIDALQPANRADIEFVLQRSEIRALDQQEAEIARQMRLLGIARAITPRCQQPDARFRAAARRRQPIAKRREEGRMALHVQPRLQAAQRPRDRQPVLQRIARACGAAQMIGQHAPFAGRPAPEIDRDELQMMPARRHQARHRSQEEGRSPDQRRRDQPTRD